MPKILENEALALAQGIDSLPPDQQAQAANVLRRYREQQHDLGAALERHKRRERLVRRGLAKPLF